MPGAEVQTDEASSYVWMPEFTQGAVNHSGGEYVRCIESFWALFKRGYYGTYHHMSRRHLRRYLTKVSGRRNVRSADTAEQIRRLAGGLAGRADCPAAA